VKRAIKRAIISWLIFETVLILGVVLIWYLFHPFFVPDELHIGYAISLSIFCVCWLILWIGWLDKKIDKNQMERICACNMIGNWYCKLICLKKKRCDCYKEEVKNL